MHTMPMKDDNGNSFIWNKCLTLQCQKCGRKKVSYRVWAASCGGHKNIQYRCQKCGYGWWGNDAK